MINWSAFGCSTISQAESQPSGMIRAYRYLLIELKGANVAPQGTCVSPSSCLRSLGVIIKHLAKSSVMRSMHAPPPSHTTLINSLYFGVRREGINLISPEFQGKVHDTSRTSCINLLTVSIFETLTLLPAGADRCSRRSESGGSVARSELGKFGVDNKMP